MTLQLEAMPPIYQMKIKSDDSPFITTTGEVRVDEGSSLCIQCDVDEQFVQETTVLHRNQKKLEEVKREKRSVALHIHKYDEASHSGLYLCEAKSNNGTMYSRQLRVLGKRVIPADYPSCSDEYKDLCGSHGRCAIEAGTPTCYCDPSYTGKQCDSMLVTDYISMSNTTENNLNVVEVGAGVSGTLHLVSIVLAILFGVLYFKQRRQYKCMVSYYGPLPIRNEFGELPKNPYVAVCEHYQDQEKKLLNRKIRIEEPMKLNGIQKFRKAIRTRLPGTSDSKILESGLDIP